jgi:hypothetical protein
MRSASAHASSTLRPSAITTNSSPPKTIGEIRHPRGCHHIEHDALENRVAGGMTVTVIEGLEMIDVDEQ